MKKVFIDTNILLDVILGRVNDFPEAAAVWEVCEQEKIKGFIAANSVTNVYYISAKIIGKSRALEGIRIALNLFTVVPLDEKILRMAADLPHRDYEDAVQLFSAVHIKADCLVTRDQNDFSTDFMPILGPAEFLSLLKK